MSMISPSHPDRIPSLEAELKAMTAERDMYRSLANRRVSRDASTIENARDWREFCRIIAKAAGHKESRGL